MDKGNSSALVDLYQYYLSKGDPRVKDWFMMDSPMKTLGFLVLYFVALAKIKDHMENRKPYELKLVLIVYNALQVFGSFYIFFELLTVAYLSNYSLVCQPVDYSNDPLAMRMLSVLWYYYMSKLIDLLDTVFFALRKKQNQITFLHVFHHSTMFPYGWIGLKYVGGGQTFFLCMLNSFVHTVMYAYYALAAVGPEMQKHLWWKKYLTQLQLIQFFAVMTHSVVNAFSSDCSFPKSFSISYLVYGFITTLLFMNFYSHSYNKRNSATNSARAVQERKTQ